MVKHIISIALLSFVCSQGYAQRPMEVIVNGNLGKPTTARQKAQCRNAGTITFGAHRGQSNDVTPDTIYLCFGDELDILHNENPATTGDPVPATAPGVGYGFYNCRPTIDGPNVATIRTDSCLVLNPPPISVRTPYYISVGSNLKGDITFKNDTFIQNRFNGGAPGLFWFAPVTYDALENGRAEYENIRMGDPIGPCAGVSINEAFAVVYLNSIKADSINTNVGTTGCMGSFRVSGGLPQFSPLTRYTVDISMVGSPSIKGRIGNAPADGEMVPFFVPQSGTYNVTVSDGKSCSATFTVNMTSCTAVTLSLPAVNTLPGMDVCVRARVENFDSIGSFQFTIKYDPKILDFLNVGGFNPALQSFSSANVDENEVDGTITVLWGTVTSATLPDTSSLFEICFRAIGALGTESLLQFVNSPTPIEVISSRGGEFGIITRNGIISLSNNQIIPLLEQDSVSCPNARDGGFKATVFGGTPPYQLRFRSLNPAGALSAIIPLNSSGSSVNIDSLGAGDYEVVIQDAANPTNRVTDTVRVIRGPLLGVSLRPTQPTCFGDSTGSMRAVVILDGVEQTNPESQFRFTWNPPVNGNTSFLDSIPFNNGNGGNYAVTVTDRNNCTVTASATLSQPPRIVATPTITNATCSGSENGAIRLAIVGGIGTYRLRWSDGGDSTVNRTNLNPGQYSVTVTDSNGCSIVAGPFTVGAVKTLSIQLDSLKDVTCNGDRNGLIRVTGRTTGPGQALPYRFNWQGPTLLTPASTPTTSALSNLGAGTYVLTMSDSDPIGCSVVDTFRITEPDLLIVSFVGQQNETCTTGSDGSAIISVEGGTTPYRYAWTGGQRDSIARNLPAGEYTIVVTDSSNCADSLLVTIESPTPPTIETITNDTVSCPNSTDGSLNVTATPVPSTTITGYRWNTGATTQTINSLSPGLYTVTVTASDGCANVDSAIVASPGLVVLDSFTTVSPTCPGFNNGRIAVFVSGGTAPYNYIWSDTSRTDSLSANVFGQVRAGTYRLTVRDANNCTPLDTVITLTDPPRIQIAFDTNTIEATSCFESTCDGSATATAVYEDGSSGAFRFSWESNEVDDTTATSTAVQLCAGFQVLVVTDTNQCFTIDSVNIPSPPAISIQPLVEPVSCNGLSNGRITLNTMGGVPPFTFAWANGRNSATIDSLLAGVYEAVVTDNNGCNKTQIVQLDEPAALQLSLDLNSTTPAVSCNGDDDGRITVRYNENDSINPVGSAPFRWSNNVADSASATALNLAPGTYTVSLTDVKGCTDTLAFTILEPQPIIAVIGQPAEPLCFGESTVIEIDTVYGGTGMSLFDYTFQVDNNGLRFTPDQTAKVFAGRHIITIEDPAGCDFSDTLEIGQPEDLQVIFDPNEIEVELGDSITLSPIINSSLAIAAYIWTPGDSTLSANNIQNPSADPIRTTRYRLTVVDENGCRDSALVTVDVDFNRNIYIPNVFSANGDGPNDEFRIFACNGVTAIKSASVFDRWGNQVYSAQELAPICSGVRLWDGRFNGKIASAGVYVYVIQVEFLDGTSLVYRGDVTLLR